jgi:hypothetical protein
MMNRLAMLAPVLVPLVLAVAWQDARETAGQAPQPVLPHQVRLPVAYRRHLVRMPRATSTPGQPAPSARRLGLGVNLADLTNAPYVTDMGFGWIRGYLRWSQVEPQPGRYDWRGLYNYLDIAQRHNLRLLLLVYEAPSWARRPGTTSSGPPAPEHMAAWSALLRQAAERARGTVQAYQIWSEPNLSWAWGGLPPDPQAYAKLLRSAYASVKAADPWARVVSAGLATNGEDNQRAVSDLLFIQRMYAFGARGAFDVLGSHPFGFAYPPETDPNQSGINGLAFRRAEQQYHLLTQLGDPRPIWATEFGWLVQTAPLCYEWGDWPTRRWQMVSEQQQADYLVRAFDLAERSWPWMEAMFVFNMDFATTAWTAGCPGAANVCDPARFYSMLERPNPCDPQVSLIVERPAFAALRAWARAATRGG